jgi:hypothetical protein
MKFLEYINHCNRPPNRESYPGIPTKVDECGSQRLTFQNVFLNEAVQIIENSLVTLLSMNGRKSTS